jgi:hypothetical protein
MTAHHDLDRQLTDFLRSGPDELPYESFDAVRDRTELTSQRVVIGPWRLPEMNKIVTFGLGAAAVVVIGILLGGQLLGSPADTGNSGGPTATPQASSPGESTSEPSAAGPTDFAALPMGTRLEEGDYVFTHMDGVRVVFSASPLWERNIPDWVVWTIDDDKATMGAFLTDTVAADPCQPELGVQEPAVGPTVDDLATALRAVPGVTFSAPVEVSQDGYSGVRLDYVPPDDLNNCLEDMSHAALMYVAGAEGSEENYVPAPNGTQAFSVYIYDVDGTRAVITAAYTQNRTDDLDELLASVRFEKP